MRCRGDTSGSPGLESLDRILPFGSKSRLYNTSVVLAWVEYVYPVILNVYTFLAGSAEVIISPFRFSELSTLRRRSCFVSCGDSSYLPPSVSPRLPPMTTIGVFVNAHKDVGLESTSFRHHSVLQTN